MCHVLVVDDDPIHHYLVQYLGRNQSAIASLKCFLEPADALDHLTISIQNNTQLPDVILLDINMPVIDGWKFLERLQILFRHTTANIRVFLLTSALSCRNDHQIKQYPFVKGYFIKPLTTKILEQLIAPVSASRIKI